MLMTGILRNTFDGDKRVRCASRIVRPPYAQDTFVRDRLVRYWFRFPSEIDPCINAHPLTQFHSRNVAKPLGHCHFSCNCTFFTCRDLRQCSMLTWR